MALRYKSSAALAVACLGIASSAQAALQVSLHQVNTSVGLKPTNATNQWKLQTDPAIENISNDPVEYTLGAELNNTYDPTQFSLAVSPISGTYALGYSVQGI